MRPVVSNPEIYKKLQSIIAEVTGNDPEDILYDMELSELSMSIMDRAQLLAHISSEFGVKISRQQFEDFETLEAIVQYLDDELS